MGSKSPIKRARFPILASSVALVGTLALAACGNDSDDDTASQDDVVEAAQNFLDMLDAEQQEAVTFPLETPLRANWSNVNAAEVPIDRTGIRIGDLDQEQRAAMFIMIERSLSLRGIDYLDDVLAAEAVLQADASVGEKLQHSPENYWIAIYGEPTEGSDWGWQFDGHHLAYNISFDEEGTTSLSPFFVGTEPATFESVGEEVAPLGPNVDRAEELIDALPDAERNAAELAAAPTALLTGPQEDGDTPPQQGSTVGEWSAANQESLLDIVELWVGALPDEEASTRMAEIESELDETTFAFSLDSQPGGSTASGVPFQELEDAIYYRIQGPTAIVELIQLPALLPDPNSQHFHSMYRDPTNEYGLGVSSLSDSNGDTSRNPGGCCCAICAGVA